MPPATAHRERDSRALGAPASLARMSGLRESQVTRTFHRHLGHSLKERYGLTPAAWPASVADRPPRVASPMAPPLFARRERAVAHHA